MTVKRIIALLIAVALTLGCVSLLAACGGKDDQPADGGTTPDGGSNGGDGGDQTESGENYTVTLLDVYGEPVAGIQLKLTYGDEETEVLTSDADGKVTKKIDTSEDVIVEFVELGGYGNLSSKQRNLNGDTEKTLTLPYKVTVTAVDEEGNPIEGVVFQVCHNVCLTVSPTNAEGKVVVGINSTEQVKVSVTSVPEGYAVPEEIGTYQGNSIHAYFDEGATELTITIPSA